MLSFYLETNLITDCTGYQKSVSQSADTSKKAGHITGLLFTVLVHQKE